MLAMSAHGTSLPSKLTESTAITSTASSRATLSRSFKPPSSAMSLPSTAPTTKGKHCADGQIECNSFIRVRHSRTSRRRQRRTYSRCAVHRGSRRSRHRCDALRDQLGLVFRPRHQRYAGAGPWCRASRGYSRASSAGAKSAQGGGAIRGIGEKFAAKRCARLARGRCQCEGNGTATSFSPAPRKPPTPMISVSILPD
jgi:hypothetical protein